MCGFDKTGKLGGGDQSDVSISLSSHNYDLLLIDNLIQNAGEILAQMGVARIRRHEAGLRLDCTGFLYVNVSPVN
jgi:hypothetical protein